MTTGRYPWNERRDGVIQEETPPPAAPPASGSAGINRGLRRYAEALSAPRRFRQRVLGPDTDPDYCFTDFLFAIGTKQHRRLHEVYGAERTKAPLGQASGPSGGYLVPENLNLDLMQDVAEEAIFRPRATIVDMTSSSMNVPLPDAGTAQSAATSPFFGGIKMTWTEENLTRPETEPLFRMASLHAWDLTGYALESNPLYQDGGRGLESFLRKLFARSLAWYEDYAYFQGTGVGQPVGIINSAGAKTVSRHAPTVFDNPNDVANMTKALLPISWTRAVWVVSPSVWSQMTILGGGASGISPAWQLNQPIIESQKPGATTPGQPHFLLNYRPGFVSEKLPALGTQGDVCLFDPMLYVIGDRGAVEINVSFDEPTAFKNNQAVWRLTYRGDGQPWFSKVITLQDASTTVSPYVVLV